MSRKADNCKMNKRNKRTTLHKNNKCKSQKVTFKIGG